MPARLGDDVDDFCIKCKRLTNHVVVSLINDGPAKVRCRTCHSDHDYRNEQAPPPKVDPRKLLKDLAKSAAAAPVDGVAIEVSPVQEADPEELLIPVDLSSEILAAAEVEVPEPVGAQAGSQAGKASAAKAKSKKAQR